jgi:hypothetical protein
MCTRQGPWCVEFGSYSARCIGKFPHCCCCTCFDGEDERGGQRPHFHKPIASVCHVTPCCERALSSQECSFNLIFAVDGKIEKCVCSTVIPYRNPLNASWGFWRKFFKLYSGCWMVFTFQGQLSVSWRWQMFEATVHQKMLKKCKHSSTKTTTEQSVSFRTPLGSVMELAMRSWPKFERALQSFSPDSWQMIRVCH